jgi:hypothetical protein
MNEPVAATLDPTTTNAANAALTDLWNRSSARYRRLPTSLQEVRDQRWRPVVAPINPHPPYSPTDPRAYLNSLTGDFDLFAVWPALLGGSVLTLADLARVSDRYWAKKAQQTAGLFMPVPGKPAAVAAVANQRFIIDCPPSPTEADNEPGIEDPDTGCINPAVELVAGTVNSLITQEPDGYRRNACFHSDDGANPFFDALDWPIAMFVPLTRTTDEPRGAGRNQPGYDPVAWMSALPCLITDTPEFVGALSFFLNESPDYRDVYVPMNLALFRLLMAAQNTNLDPLRDVLLPADLRPNWDLAAARVAFGDARLAAAHPTMDRVRALLQLTTGSVSRPQHAPPHTAPRAA